MIDIGDSVSLYLYMIVSVILFFAIVLLPLIPVTRFTVYGWGERRNEILQKIDPDVIEAYVDRFMPVSSFWDVLRDPSGGWERHKPGFSGGFFETRDVYLNLFSKHYDSFYGMNRYKLPIFLLGYTLIAVAITITATVLPRITNAETDAIIAFVDAISVFDLPPIVISSLCGSYIWVTYDLIARAHRRDMPPTAITRAAVRIIVFIPVGYAFSEALSALNLSIDNAIAICLGAFPLESVFRFMRRIVTVNLGLGRQARDESDELQNLQGIDVNISERLHDEGITTILQLAYSNPIDISMRCNLSFSTAIDIVGQALAWLYIGEKLPLLYKLGLRGAQEIGGLVDDLKATGSLRKAAQLTLNEAAIIMGVSPTALYGTLKAIDDDPYANFLFTVWY
ncbi:hypothetical protein [Ferrovibrio sp.]|uniref:hypothetical protein n=1 Tax=Ferrovibrio sp. TaxID=1917215 RepID=UPI000CB0DEB8|nr:hypothetical protein [Ferrovibrio sp.]PJI42214.1 MAG: hypothetical protein CTR53_07195 [Ferrovibrio sp.]